MLYSENKKECLNGNIKEPCFIPAQEILNLVSKKWGIQLIHLLREGKPKRYTDIKDELHKGLKKKQISDATLSDRLSEFVKKGIIVREVQPDIPPRVEYCLTKRGKDLSQVLQPLIKWAIDICHEEL
ncbi:MAG: helix-turn-helix transcriptional regulator [Candidatus Heimdallarchaeota archaeon]|nr:helix-turn-helix transcriptional regulator [Candidatus Heimdallarchaeota archaeon]